MAISMPYYSNGSVLSRLNSLNFLDLQEALKCLIDILRGLEYLHENGYYHCDIKPNNILVGDREEYLLTDYGITCYSPDQAVTPRQSYLPHISPETLDQDTYDGRTDIYQLGLTEFRLINGISEIRVDFDKDRVAFNEKVLKGKVINPSNYKPYVPHVLRRIINKATCLNPDDRYQTPLEMRRALERVRLIGNCTGDMAGNLLLLQGYNTYRYEIIPLPKNKFMLLAYKRNNKSGNETRYSKYCLKDLSFKQIHKSIQEF
ncbi:MAG: protein kinase [Bacillota bacterium]